MATGDLVTLGQVQTAYPGLTAAQLADVPQLIAAVSAEVSRRYPRCALRARYDETHDPGPSRTIALRRRPVLAVVRVRSDMAKVLTLSYSGAGRRASAEVVNSGEADAPVASSLALYVELGGVAQATISLSFSTYPTVQDLATHVNGLGDWTATVNPGQGAMACTDLEPTQGPKSAVGGVGAGVWGYTRDLDDFALTDPLGGELLLYQSRSTSYSHPGSVWGSDPRVTSVRVTYDAGRLATSADVARAVMIVVGAELENTSKAGDVNYETGAGYAYRVSVPSYRFPPDAERILSRFKDRRFV